MPQPAKKLHPRRTGERQQEKPRLRGAQAFLKFPLAFHYSGFDSALFKNLDAQWHFPQENATLLDLQMSTRESKPL